MFNAPFHCYEKVFIFNKWIEGAGHGRQVEQLGIITYCSISEAIVMTCWF